MTTPANDPFLPPAQGGSLSTLEGRLLLVYPQSNDKAKSKFPTRDGSGLVDRVTCRIIVLDGDEPGKKIDRVQVMSGSMTGQLLPYVGKNMPVLGRLAKTKFDAGMGWDLKEATDDEKNTARAWIAANPEEKPRDPFATASA